jgi:LacI family transcriptional regulator
LDAAKRLNFRPNLVARSLRTGEPSRTIGLVIGDLANPFYFKLAAAIEAELAKAGMTLLLGTSDENDDSEIQVVESLLAQQVRGLFIIPVASSQGYLSSAQAVDVPVVFLDRPARGIFADTVALDNRNGMRDATMSLIKAGHQHIGFIASHGHLFTIQERLAGFRDALLYSQSRFESDWVTITEHDDVQLENGIARLLADPDGPTAFVSGNNRSSVAFVKAYLKSSRRVGFIGFDDFELAEALGLNVVDFSISDMGKLAAVLLLRRLENGEGELESHVIPTNLMDRGSAGLVRGIGMSTD